MAEAAPLVNLRIPNELLSIIFQFLPFADLKNALLVCRLAIETKKEDFVQILFRKIMELIPHDFACLAPMFFCFVLKLFF